VARTLNNLGILNAEQNRNEEARKAYEEAFNDLRGTCQTEFRAVRARCCTCSKSS
jgi:Tetratricopeptide repeat